MLISFTGFIEFFVQYITRKKYYEKQIKSPKEKVKVWFQIKWVAYRGQLNLRDWGQGLGTWWVVL